MILFTMDMPAMAASPPNFQKDCGNSRHSLPEQGGRAAVDDLLQIMGGKMDPVDIQPDVLSLGAGVIQHKDRQDLPKDRGDGGAGDAHVKHQDQQWVQSDIQDGPGKEPEHGVHGVALEPELIVDHKLPHHKGRPQKDYPEVVHRVL